MAKRTFLGCLVATVVFSSRAAVADDFAPGSLIIPMDTTYQDSGMLRAFGLVYELLRNGVPVQWVIRPGKAHLGADFTATATDHQTGEVVAAHGYRGGPWVIDAADAPKAISIVDAWQKANPLVAVHVVTEPFWGDVARYLIVAPTIAMHQDGNEKIARAYLQAAGIPDSTLDLNWPATSPDMLTPAEVAGPTSANHRDGKLFDGEGDPVYCQFMSMHWGVNEATSSPETVLEVREYLRHPVHFFAECQAVNAFEGAPPVGGRGNFLTTQGYQWPAPAQPKSLEFFNDDSPFAQLDGAFQSVGGSEPAYSLPFGAPYHVGGVVMIKKAGTPEGDSDLWMTGFLDGACPPDVESCDNDYGKVSYLGGHEYSTNLPISKNPQAQGTRLFLNSLFEAPCATRAGQPDIVLVNSAPGATSGATVTYTFDYANSGSGVAVASVISDRLPAGGTFVSASPGYVLSGNTVSWALGNLGSYESGQVTLTIQLSTYGSYANSAHLGYQVGLNSFGVDSNTTNTTYAADSDGDGIVDALDICPNDFNPIQNINRDNLSCGSCGNVCSVTNGNPKCNGGICAIESCQNGFSDCDGLYATGCEHVDTGQKCCDCSPANAIGACVAGGCTITGCNPGFSDCDQSAASGCEYDNANFSTDPNHCGNCNTKCSFANATALCEAGSCKMGGCSAAFVDVDGKASNGCECNKLGAVDTTCDGVDDDCNGAIDDGYVPASCGIGVCAAKSRCVAGKILPCVVGAASAEGPAGDPSCADDVDNDCSGTTDAADAHCVLVGAAGSNSGGSAGAPSVGDLGGAIAVAGTSAGGLADTSSAGPETTLGGSNDQTRAVGGSTTLGGNSLTLGGSDATTLGGNDGLPLGGSYGTTPGGLDRPALAGANNSASGVSNQRSAGGATQAGGSVHSAAAGSSTGPATSSSESNGDDAGCGCKIERRSRKGSTSAAIALALGVAFACGRRRRSPSDTLVS